MAHQERTEVYAKFRDAKNKARLDMNLANGIIPKKKPEPEPKPAWIGIFQEFKDLIDKVALLINELDRKTIDFLRYVFESDDIDKEINVLLQCIRKILGRMFQLVSGLRKFQGQNDHVLLINIDSYCAIQMQNIAMDYKMLEGDHIRKKKHFDELCRSIKEDIETWILGVEFS